MTAIKRIYAALARLRGRPDHPSRFIEIYNKRFSDNERVARFTASYNLRRGLPPQRLRYEPLSRDDIARLVEAPFDEALAKLGFERASRKIWARRRTAPICHLFSLTRYGSTGCRIAPSFGFSLDFVPHIAAGKIHWHRTLKSSRFDFRLDTESRWFGTSDLGPERKVTADVEFMLPRALKMATEFWASVTTLEDAARMFSDFDLYMGRRFKMTKSNRLVFIRPSPAEAFVKAKTGSLAEACNLLDQWLATEERISKYRFDEGVRERIHQLLAEAAETG